METVASLANPWGDLLMCLPSALKTLVPPHPLGPYILLSESMDNTVSSLYIYGQKYTPPTAACIHAFGFASCFSP